MIRQRLKRVLSCLMLCALLLGSVAAPAAAAQFSDVPASHPAAEAIRRCVDLGFFQGETSTRFGVGNPITRGAFAQVMCCFFGWERVWPDRPTYSDVPQSAWYYGAVETAAANGALTDQSSGFRPEDALTREELAVMLVRALGYGTLAGLVQDLAIPYKDVRTNLGYIVVAYDLDLIDGTSSVAFSPSATVAREELAMILMRLYDKLQNPALWKQGLALSAEGLPSLEGYGVTAIPAGKLMYIGKAVVMPTMETEEVITLRTAAREAGASPMLYVVGGPTVFNGKPAEMAQALADAVSEGGYDGVILEIGQLKYGQDRALNQLAASVAETLPEDQLFYLVVEAPSWHGITYDGYDYAALAQWADRLVLRVASFGNVGESFPTAPVEPLEEIYYALGQLRDIVDKDRLALLVPTEGAAYLDGEEGGPLTRAEINALLDSEEAKAYYSNRYGCAYLTAVQTENRKEREVVAWYLDGRGIQERAKLMALFGVDQLLLTDLSQLPRELRADGAAEAEAE